MRDCTKQSWIKTLDAGRSDGLIPRGCEIIRGNKMSKT